MGLCSRDKYAEVSELTPDLSTVEVRVPDCNGCPPLSVGLKTILELILTVHSKRVRLEWVRGDDRCRKGRLWTGDQWSR